jgi:hypothetical protein
MTGAIERGYARIVAARQRLLDARTERVEALLRCRGYLRMRLSAFTGTVDPVDGVRLADVCADGSRTSGELSVTVAFFDGTKLRLSVDQRGALAVVTDPPDLLADLGTIVDLRVSADGTRAEIAHESGDVRRRLDVAHVLERLVERALASAEAQLAAAPLPEPAMASRPGDRARPGLSFSVR